MKEKQHVLFVCVGNSGRSQMAEGFAKKLGLSASSAGTAPAKAVNPVVVQLMQEKDIDISSNKPKMLTNEMIEEASLVITMGLLCRGGLSQTNACQDAEEAGRLGS